MTIALPAEIDMANSASVQAILAAAIASRPAIVLADLTATTFIDSSAIRVLWKAHRDAAVQGIQLRLVTTEAGVLRVLELTGLGQQLPIYPTIAAALTS